MMSMNPSSTGCQPRSRSMYSGEDKNWPQFTWKMDEYVAFGKNWAQYVEGSSLPPYPKGWPCIFSYCIVWATTLPEAWRLL